VIKQHVVGELQFFEGLNSSEYCVGPQYISCDPVSRCRNAEAWKTNCTQWPLRAKRDYVPCCVHYRPFFQ